MSAKVPGARWIGWTRLLAWLAAVGVCLAGWEFAAGTVGVALRSVIPHAIPHSGPAGSPLEAQRLDPKLGDPGATQVAGGSLDGYFTRFMPRGSHFEAQPLWLRLPPVSPAAPGAAAIPVLVARAGIDQSISVFARRSGQPLALTPTTVLPQFGGAQDSVYALPAGLDPDTPFYVRVMRSGPAATDLRFSASTLDQALERAGAHARMIAIAFGALMAMALSTLLVRFVLTDRLYPLYGTLFGLQALYLAYFSGQGFHWPVLSWARPLSSYAWNVPVAISAAAAALFVREFANLRLFSPRVYRFFGWMALAFLGLAVANVLRVFGLAQPVAAVGNLMFLGSALLTLVVSFLAWRNGNRAAGWFLIAWALLSTFQILTAVRLLYGQADSAERLLYYGLAPSMVAAAVLIALGTSDRMRAQTAALTDAELRAQTDPLTGVLNRRSLIERLDAACMRAKARGQPIAVLFIDLDHFKQINDTCGHAAGDACLSGIIPPIHAELRQSDVIGRYGGEEFVVILSGADSTSAHPIAERICKRVSEVRIEGFGEPIAITCSIGIAASDTLGVWGQHLIAHADTAQYVAKRSGRNQVQLATSLAA
ncbi:MAG TPA: diguanylate cyclase [Steroidobacteraceae bacterium]|nr:diguanylate cyclase [Steroidobacteraceae bacterium]